MTKNYVTIGDNHLWTCEKCGNYEITRVLCSGAYETPAGWYEVSPLGKVDHGIKKEFERKFICPDCFKELF